MRPPVQLCADYDAPDLRALAKASRDANQTRRLLALAAIYDGASRREVAKIGGIGVQTVRDWVLAFNGEGPPGLIDGKAPGNPTAVECRAARGAKADRRSRPEPGGGRGGTLAADRSGAVGVRGVWHFHQQTDAEPDAARDGLSQALGSSARSRPGPRRSEGF